MNTPATPATKRIRPRINLTLGKSIKDQVEQYCLEHEIPISQLVQDLLVERLSTAKKEYVCR